MKLAAVARRFEKTPVYDAYAGGAALFNCQPASFDDSSSIGATSRRRAMMVAPGTTIPARRAVTVLNDTWLVGDKNTDGFLGGEIREGYNLRKAFGLYALLSPAQAALGAVGLSAYGQPQYYKDTVDVKSTTDTDTIWRIFLSITETAVKGTILKLGTTFYRARNAYETTDRFLIVECDDLGQAFQSVAFTNNTYNVLTDTYSAVAVSTTGLLMDYMQAFQRDNEGVAVKEAGDQLLLVAKSAVTPKNGAALTVGGKAYRVVAIADELDAYLLHLRAA